MTRWSWDVMLVGGEIKMLCEGLFTMKPPVEGKALRMHSLEQTLWSYLIIHNTSSATFFLLNKGV